MSTAPDVAAPGKIEIVGTGVSVTSYEEVLRLIESRPAGQATTFAFCNVHSIMTARKAPAVAAALRRTTVAAADGMPLVWALHHLGHPEQRRVYGPDLMEAALAYGVTRGWKHYFYGATAETLVRLRAAVERLAPGAQIVGMNAPPFRPLQPHEEAAVLAEIRDSGADLVWVGLGMPKQELWIDRVQGQLPGTALLAVGAAFDLVSGTVRQAPDWVQDRGLEWLYRLWREPRRLWRRYIVNNPLFAVLALRQLVQRRAAGGT
jgi:N-acetylglucosaminyldiphosphoundecaprenol N-acetyl-beta-D-mannosaminyltransferase